MKNILNMLPVSIEVTELKNGFSVSTIKDKRKGWLETMVFDTKDNSVFCKVDTSLESALKTHRECIKKFQNK